MRTVISTRRIRRENLTIQVLEETYNVTDTESAFNYFKAGRNERPPRVGVNLILVLAQVAPAQLFLSRTDSVQLLPPA
jgi:hypothetical protein